MNPMQVIIILMTNTVTKYMSSREKIVSEVSPMDLKGISPLQAASGDLAAHHPSLQRMHWKAILMEDDT
jgi:hypothetical protein